MSETQPNPNSEKITLISLNKLDEIMKDVKRRQAEGLIPDKTQPNPNLEKTNNNNNK